MDTTLELSDRAYPVHAAAPNPKNAATQGREGLACRAARLALVALMVAGIMVRVVMFIAH